MPFFRRRSDDDFAREIQAHLDLEAERLKADGLPADEARAAARRRFGNVTRACERFRESGRSLSWDRLAQDVRGAWRSMARSPIAVLVAVLSLAGGIGSTTAILTVRNAVFYNPPPLYRDAGELTRIRVVTPDRVRGDAVPGALLRSWMAGADLRPAIAASGRTRSGELR